ncbi:MAG: (2Fe-2S)-binding protein [Planctomycetes bacterium]|nr:(2Fe-2S)-binding protein [Planctomycetota bacterium]
MKRERIVCESLKVTEKQVLACVRDGKACSLRQIAACTGAGGGCTACHPALEAILEKEGAAAYWPASPSFSAR